MTVTARSTTNSLVCVAPNAVQELKPADSANGKAVVPPFRHKKFVTDKTTTATEPLTKAAPAKQEMRGLATQGHPTLAKPEFVKTGYKSVSAANGGPATTKSNPAKRSVTIAKTTTVTAKSTKAARPAKRAPLAPAPVHVGPENNPVKPENGEHVRESLRPP